MTMMKQLTERVSWTVFTGRKETQPLPCKLGKDWSNLQLLESDHATDPSIVARGKMRELRRRGEKKRLHVSYCKALGVKPKTIAAGLDLLHRLAIRMVERVVMQHAASLLELDTRGRKSIIELAHDAGGTRFNGREMMDFPDLEMLGHVLSLLVIGALVNFALRTPCLSLPVKAFLSFCQWGPIDFLWRTGMTESFGNEIWTWESF
ncbi:hypothetical protein CCUS01_00881 [Colletotrichum cuscutae]|uniref:Uncharacterized protein n=1 Tax=Colletotrichum cuscutae TaxID=1209917 RepID=A0AAI9V891_9PEZI|nr:hypothetical protein CCUS01_00881 [Colletotrichum cuscutae]